MWGKETRIMEKDEPPIPILLQIYLGTEKDKPDDTIIDNTIIDRNIWEEPNQVLSKHRETFSNPLPKLCGWSDSMLEHSGFYRTQVSLGSDLWVWAYVSQSLQEVVQT